LNRTFRSYGILLACLVIIWWWWFVSFSFENLLQATVITPEISVPLPISYNETKQEPVPQLPESSNEGRLTSTLRIASTFDEDCKPHSICNSTRIDELFSVDVHTFVGNVLQEINQFPASEDGRMLMLFLPSNGTIQYDVKQTTNYPDSHASDVQTWSFTYSSGCHGVLKSGESKTCLINSTLK